jgi:hypothetical protein
MRVGRVLLVGVILAALPSPASAWGRWGIGVYVGGPCFRPYWGPTVVIGAPPVYYAPAPVIVRPVAPAVVVAGSPETAETGVPPPPAPPSPPVLPAPTVRGARPVSRGGELQSLNDPSPQARADACIQLGRHRDVRAVSPLIRLVQDDGSPQVREAACRALGLIAAPEALSALQQAAGNDPDRDVRKTASFAAEVIRANLRR